MKPILKQIYKNSRFKGLDIIRSVFESIIYSDNNDVRLRSYVAAKLYTPPYILTKLSLDLDSAVRGAVAQNIYTPTRTLGYLSNDWNCYVRCSVYHNPNTPPNTIKKLSKDKKVTSIIIEPARIYP